MASHTEFQAMIDNMPKYLQKLEECEAIGLDSRVDRRALRKKLPCKGIYVLFESGIPMYVGRSNKLAGRLLEHSQLSGDSETASFAFNIAKIEFAGSDTLSTTRRDLQRDDVFQRHFQEAKERVRKMSVRAVEVKDPIEQTILEVYIHLLLETPFNSFENH